MIKLKIKFLGSGSAFVEADENYQSNILITKYAESDLHDMPVTLHENLLFDAGTTISEALKYNNITLDEINNIFISHNHADHNGGMEYIGFKRYFGSFPFGELKPNLFGNTEVLESLWENSLKGGMESIQGQVNTLETFFNPSYISPNGSFNCLGLEFNLVQVIHVVDNRRFVPCYGLMFSHNDKKVFITGDTQYSPNQLLTYYQQSDIIFHDCEFANYPNSVHAQFHQLCELDPSIKSKMWLYHYMLGDATYEELEKEVLEAGFVGLVKRGQEFEI
jgi:ribonuclease BN (tRNA processing enzyme)